MLLEFYFMLYVALCVAHTNSLIEDYSNAPKAWHKYHNYASILIWVGLCILTPVFFAYVNFRRFFKWFYTPIKEE